VLDAPRRFAWNPMAIRRNERIDLVKQPGSARDLPWQDRPPSLTANGQRQSDRLRPAHFDSTVGNGPRCSVTFGLGDTGRLTLSQRLRRNDLKPFVFVEATHPASATGAKTSIAIENKCGALGPSVRKMPEGDGSHTHSVPAPD
jgi:hypothetical protein